MISFPPAPKAPQPEGVCLRLPCYRAMKQAHGDFHRRCDGASACSWHVRTMLHFHQMGVPRCPYDKHPHTWRDMARTRIKFHGLPARIRWIGLGDRHRLGLAFNAMVASGELQAPVVIERPRRCVMAPTPCRIGRC